MPNFIYTFLVSLGAGAVIYLLTRTAIGKSADHLPGGAIAMVYLLSPWWAALSGAVIGHIAAVLAMRFWSNKPRPRNLVSIGLVTLAGYLCASLYTSNVAINEAGKIAQTATEQAWSDFGKEGESSVVTLAATTRGQSFANEIQAALLEWDKWEFDPAAAAKIDKIVASL